MPWRNRRRAMLVFVAGYTILDAVSAFMGVSKLAVASRSRVRLNVASQMREENDFSAGLQRVNSDASSSRRAALEHLGTLAIGLGVLSAPPALADTCTRKDCQPQANFLPEGDEPRQKDIVKMPGLQGKNYGKTTTRYADYKQLDSGLQYKDVKVGTGPTPQDGDRVVYDWEGYTIGYYGRIFKAKSGVKGGAFTDDTEYERFIVGSGTVVPGLEEGIRGMSVGGVRQIVVPPDLGYPLDDPPHDKVGPKPPNFDGQRALNFVLFNQGLIDKTLLFNVKVIRIDKVDGSGGFKRGEIQATSSSKLGAKSSKKAAPKKPEPEEEEEEEE